MVRILWTVVVKMCLWSPAKWKSQVTRLSSCVFAVLCMDQVQCYQDGIGDVAWISNVKDLISVSKKRTRFKNQADPNIIEEVPMKTFFTDGKKK